MGDGCDGSTTVFETVRRGSTPLLPIRQIRLVVQLAGHRSATGMRVRVPPDEFKK